MSLYVVKKEKRNPKKVFRIMKAKYKIRKLKLFDKKYYLKQFSNANKITDPLNHYIYHGYKKHKNPSKSFDNDYYLNKYSDVEKSGINPLVHYVLYGIEENRYKNKKEESQSFEYLNSRLKIQQKEIMVLKNELNMYTSVYRLPHINKEKIQSEIENFKDCGVTQDKRTPKLIVSLTSYPERMYDIHYCLYSLLNQSLKPDELILWLAKEEFPNLDDDVPKKVLELKNHGLKIKWCKDIKSYIKLIPTLKEFPDDIIVTADDDVFYPKDWLELLYSEYLNNKNSVVCHRAHYIDFDDNKFHEYSKWKKTILNDKPSYFNFFTGVGGILYPPKILYKDAKSENIFKKLSPNADDLWFWAMTVLNKKKIKIVENGYNYITYINPKRELGLSEEKTLFHENQKGRNDEQLENIVNYYPELVDILKTELIIPKISVIVPVYNAGKYLKKCLDSLINQTLKDIEIICVNDGSTDKSLETLRSYEKKDKRITVINHPKNLGNQVAKNTGLKNAKGDYIGFSDNDDWVDLNFFETLYKEAKSQNADLARTCYYYNYPNKEVPSEINGLINKKYDANEYLGMNDHSVVNWNAIYRRKYMIDNDIYYYDDILGVDDVPFTARTTYYSKKTIPVVGTYYHHREKIKNQLSTLNLKKVKNVLKANKTTIDFFNSVEFDDKEDYLVAFERCIWRYDYIFKDALELEDFNVKEQKIFFEEFVDNFNKCKYLEDFQKDYYKPYLKYLDENSFDSYINYKMGKK
jgi:glycosyltransferase involved in cell wall biosynthesis